MHQRLLGWLSVVCFMALPADATTLYKVINPDGTVTYQDERPSRGFAGRVEVKDIDPDANVIPIERFPPGTDYRVPGPLDATGTPTPPRPAP